jgi:predicted signal transduction protein with EAL and GGDEF domain
MLALEVSEETGTTAASTTFFAQLAGSGVRVSLDDFGTGFASLESLGGWPIDELKLDRSIVRPMATSASFHTIVATTIDLAHQLGIRVVAEGIETDAVSSELKALRCDIGQGFFFGRPMPAAAFTKWMRDPARLAQHPEARCYPPAIRPAGEAGPRGLAGGAASRAARAARRAVQPVGGRALVVAVAMMAAYLLWQVFRWGGREHQALIGDLAFIPVNGAAAVGIDSLRAAQIADQLARPTARVLGRAGKPLTYTTSIGIAESLPGWDLPALLAHADQAMYEAKRAGGGSWRIFQDTTQASQAATRQAAATLASQAANRHL